MAWPVVAAQPDTGIRSRRHGRCLFGWLEQEDQRLKKHYGRWMEIIWSLELESFILTKLTKPSIPVIPRKVIEHHLAVCPHARPVKQKVRKQALERQEFITEEIRKLC